MTQDNEPNTLATELFRSPLIQARGGRGGGGGEKEKEEVETQAIDLQIRHVGLLLFSP